MSKASSAKGQRNRQYWLSLNGPCAHCGSWEDLQIDHIDPASKDPRLKGGQTALMWRWSPEQREAELIKCQPLCAPCHWSKTANERRKS